MLDTKNLIDAGQSISPIMAAAHLFNQGDAFASSKRYDEAVDCFEKSIALNPNNGIVYFSLANTLYAAGRFDAALASYDKLVALTPDLTEIYNNRGLTLRELGRFDESLTDFDKAIALKPDYAEAFNNRGSTLQSLFRFDDALASYDKALALRPDYAKAHNNRGNVLQNMKRFDEALTGYNDALAIKPDYAEAHQNRGVTLVCLGKMPEAEAAFVKALDLCPQFPKALFSLSYIRKHGRGDHDDIGHILSALDKPSISPDDKEQLYYSLGKIYDDCGLYDEAFDAYRKANDLRNASAFYDRRQTSMYVERLIKTFDAELMSRPFGTRSGGPSPLFILGMPRSGTTLAASILSNHRSVETAGELRNIGELTIRMPELTGTVERYPGSIKNISPDLAARMIDDYRQRLCRDVQMGAGVGNHCTYIVDKHPCNFLHLGLIALMFPDARVIHCTRHPLDTCLSNYFQRFPIDFGYSFDLANIGHYHRQYERLMAHWRECLPLKMLDVSYENVIADTETAVRQMLNFLELDWDDRCLAPHTNPCAVETSSNWQVRQPIYSQSVDRWRHYDKHLASLKAAFAE